MKQKMIHICAMGLLAMISISAHAEGQKDQNDQDATKSVIALAAGAVAAAGPAAGTVHFYKKANKLGQAGMSLAAWNDKALRAKLLKEEEAAAGHYTRGMVLSVLAVPTGILTAMNLMGVKQSDANVAKQEQKAQATQQVGGMTPQPSGTSAGNASAY